VKRRRPALATITSVLAVASIALAACHGGSDTNRSAQRAATPATSATRDFSGATVASGSARVSVDYTAGATHLQGNGVVDFGHWAANLGIDAGHKTRIQEIESGNTLYLGVPSEAMLAKTQPEWVAISLNAPGIARALSRGTDPAALLDGASSPLMLISATAAVSAHAEGTAVVRGTKTTRYRATADLASAGKSANANIASAAPVLAGITAAREPTIEIWLDASHRVRRLRLHISPSAAALKKKQAAAGTVTIDFYDFGAHANVKAPPVVQVRRPEAAPVVATTTPTTMPDLPPALPPSLSSG
jgi:hypothetical protein